MAVLELPHKKFKGKRLLGGKALNPDKFWNSSEIVHSLSGDVLLGIENPFAIAPFPGFHYFSGN